MMNEWILSSSILIAAVLAIRFLLRGKISLRLQYAMWAVVLVRLLLPVQLFTSSFGAGSIAQDVDISAPVRQVYATAREEVYQRDYDTAYRQVVADYEGSSQSYDPIVVEKTAQDMARQRMELDLSKLLLGLWFAGMVVMTSVVCSCNIHLSLHLRRSRRPYPAAESRLPVYVTEAVPTPCVFGLFRPAIYLTPAVAEDARTRDHVLVHELTHYRHWDHLWSLLRGVCLVLHWYNPLVWVAAQVSRADAELACDEGALKTIGEKHRGDYGRTLIGLTCANRVDSSLITATTMTGSAGSIRERIKLLMKRPRNTVLTLTAVILMLTLIVGCAFAAAPDETTQTPTGTTAPAETTVPVETTAPTLPAEETNILRQFTLPPNYSGDGEYSNFVYESPYLRSQIKTITIVDTLANAPEECWDASEAHNGAVLVWVEPNGELYDLYIGAEGGVWAGQSARNMFRGYTNAERIDFGGAFHTEGVRDMYSMFLGCESLRELDLSGFDTSLVTDMTDMFAVCHALEKVDLSSFDTSRVELMSGMFDWCGSLLELDLSNFNTANVNNMGGMFAHCESLTRLDLSSFRTPNLTQMIYMFDGCRSLTELDVSGFDTRNVVDMGYLFRDCDSLTELDLSHFDVGNIQYPSYKMFENCPAGSEWKHLKR